MGQKLENNPFVYVFKKSPEYEIRQSIRLVRKHYPNHPVWVIGDKPKEVIIDKYIKHSQKHRLRSTRITMMIVDICHLTDQFILIYDDIFLSERFDIRKHYHKGELYNKVRNPTGYNKCLLNTQEFLNYNNKPCLNYECHQPQYFNSKKLLNLLDMLDWVNYEHVLKSIYNNWYELGGEEIINLKVKGDHLKRAKKYWDEYGAFSSAEDMPPNLKNWLKTL